MLEPSKGYLGFGCLSSIRISVLSMSFIIELLSESRITLIMQVSGDKLKFALVMIVVASAVTATSAYAFGLLSTQKTTPNVGVLGNAYIGVYTDSECTQNVTSIDWGIIIPNSSSTYVAYIRNLGNVNATLQIETASFNPSNISNYVTLSWDYSGQPLRPKETIQVTFTLQMSEAVALSHIDSFSFDIIITCYY